MNFKNNYECGIEELDIQHKKIIDLSNSFIKDVSNKHDFLMLYNELSHTVLENLATEEKFMEKFEYPKYNNHSLAHRQIEKEMKKIWLIIAESKNINEVEMQVKQLLNKQFENHYTNFDQEMILYFKNHLDKISLS